MHLNLFMCSLTMTLKKRLLSSYNLEKIAPIQWGIHHEETALQRYCALGGIVDKSGNATVISIQQTSSFKELCGRKILS